MRYIQLRLERPSLREPTPWPATVLEVVTVTVVEAPAASVALVVPVLAKSAETTWAGPLRVSTAVRLWVEMFLTVNTLVNARAEGTRENASASVSTFPVATGMEVPAWTAVPGVTWK